jgi:hypothetical protein
MDIPLWSNDIYVVFQKEYILELWPLDHMSKFQKINAIVRLIFLLTCIGYIVTNSCSLLFISAISIVCIHVFFDLSLKKRAEGFKSNDFDSQVDYTNASNSDLLKSILKTDFHEGTKTNPFSNVLLTDIEDNPEKKAAPPSFEPNIDDTIKENIKKSVQNMNPDIQDTDKQLYGDSWEKFNLDQSNGRFYSTPNTKVVNDQGAFGKFLYGDMASAKESSIEGNLQREKNNYRHTLY